MLASDHLRLDEREVRAEREASARLLAAARDAAERAAYVVDKVNRMNRLYRERLLGNRVRE